MTMIQLLARTIYSLLPALGIAIFMTAVVPAARSNKAESQVKGLFALGLGRTFIEFSYLS